MIRAASCASSERSQPRLVRKVVLPLQGRGTDCIVSVMGMPAFSLTGQQNAADNKAKRDKRAIFKSTSATSVDKSAALDTKNTNECMGRSERSSRRSSQVAHEITAASSALSRIGCSKALRIRYRRLLDVPRFRAFLQGRRFSIAVSIDLPRGVFEASSIASSTTFDQALSVTFAAAAGRPGFLTQLRGGEIPRDCSSSRYLYLQFS